MPAVAAPPTRNQVTIPDKDHFELCGESCVASALNQSVEQVTAWIRNTRGEAAVQHGTTAEVLIAYCAAQGVGSNIVRGAAARYVGDAVGRQHYAVVLCWSDPQGRPVSYQQSARFKRGPIGHWVLGYGTDGRQVHVMQPFGGKHAAYDFSQGQDQQFGIEIHRAVGAPAAKTPDKLPKPKATPAPPKQPGGAHEYVVVRGDTLSGIAKKQKVTLAAILKANPQIKDKNKIAVGQRITIPK